jgi:hypothetical protein
LAVVTETENEKMTDARGAVPAGISHCRVEPIQDSEQLPPLEPQL